MTAPINNKPRLMSPKEAASATTMSKVPLTTMAREGRFPKPVKISTKRIAFVRAEVEQWIDTATCARILA